MNRKLVILLVAFLTLAPLAAHNPAGEVIKRTFQFDEGQAEQFYGILRNCREQIGPLTRGLREYQALLRELSNPEPGSPEPDVNAVGHAYLATQDFYRDIAVAKQECRAQFQMLLPDEELQEYLRFRRVTRWAERNARVIDALKQLGLL